MKTRKRRKILVDRKLQGELVGRALRYWLICTTAVGCFAISGWFLFSPGLLEVADTKANISSALTTLLLSLLATSLLVPIVIIDLLRFSSRFIGPMQRLLKTMDRVSRGERVEPVVFREGDFWYEFAEKFNAVVARMNDMDAKRSEAVASE